MKRTDRRHTRTSKRRRQGGRKENNGVTGVTTRKIGPDSQRCPNGSGHYPLIDSGRTVRVHEITATEALISLTSGKPRWVPKNAIRLKKAA